MCRGTRAAHCSGYCSGTSSARLNGKKLLGRGVDNDSAVAENCWTAIESRLVHNCSHSMFSCSQVLDLDRGWCGVTCYASVEEGRLAVLGHRLSFSKFCSRRNVAISSPGLIAS